MGNDNARIYREPETAEKKSKYARERNPYSEVFWDNVERIVERRHDLSWSDISRYLGTDRTTVASMRTRRSRLSLDTVIHISEILNVPVEQLLKKNESSAYDVNRLSLSEDEYQLLMEYRAVRNRRRGDSAKNILFTVLHELKTLP